MHNPSGVRVIAHYLPQFHPIPENDEWWGKGFTEWTNVARAKPLFPGHHQPNLPADLGFYDLRVPETRAAQAELAETHGIEGFCYWHYWFGNGRRILERPFQDVLATGEPSLPFCIAWANQSWSGIWHGAPGRILLEQRYPGVSDYTDHFHAVLPALADDRYITVDGKPLVLVYVPSDLPDALEFTDTWRELAHKAGLKGLFLVGSDLPGRNDWNPETDGFDASALSRFSLATPQSQTRRVVKAIRHRLPDDWPLAEAKAKPYRMDYSKSLELLHKELSDDFLQFPLLVPNWDNTPRCGLEGFVLTETTPEVFRIHVRHVFDQVRNRPAEERIVFVKSWNEWAEGNYLEPDLRFGTEHLEVLRSELTEKR
jgi:hypothetical protein